VNHVQFKSAQDLMMFLVNLRHQSGGRRQVFGSQIVVLSQGYAINFEQGDWTPTGLLCGGRIESGAATGEIMTTNGFLEHLLLRRVPPEEFAGTRSLMLALPVDAGTDLPTAQRVLHEAWEQVPRNELGRSAFYLCRNPQTASGWHAVQIDDVASSFDYASYLERNAGRFREHGLRVLAPAWDKSGCFLFVDWGFRYPMPVEFAQLHEEKQGHLILCLADREVTLSSASRDWWEPSWHVLDGDEFFTVSTLFAVARDSNPKVSHCGLVETGSEGALGVLEVPLEIGPSSDAVVSALDLEVRIGALQRELEILSGKQDRLRQRTQQDYLAVYRWHQDREAALPRGLAALLTRPLGELARFLYLQWPAPDGGWLHFVGRRDCLAAGAAMAVCCDQTYLCESRWYEWNLPLFVRSDCALNRDIGEEEMAAKVREVLPAEDALDKEFGEDGERWFLVEPQPGANGVVPSGLAGLHFTCIRFAQPLDACLRLINRRSEGPPAAAHAASQEADGSVHTHEVVSSSTARRIDERLVERASRQLTLIEQNWEEVRRQLQAAQFDLRLAEIVLHTLRNACRPVPKTWAEFVQRVLDADTQATHFKLDQLDTWDKVEPERLNQLQNFRRAQTDVAQLLVARQADYDQVLPEVERKAEEVRGHLDEIGRQQELLRQAHARLDAQSGPLESRNQALELKMRNLTQMVKVVQERLAKHTDLLTQVTALEQSLANVKARDTETTLEMEKAKGVLRGLAGDAAALQKQIQSAMKPHGFRERVRAVLRRLIKR
jgi:hypothetical protein